jgi:hypothetical protein
MTSQLATISSVLARAGVGDIYAANDSVVSKNPQILEFVVMSCHKCPNPKPGYEVVSELAIPPALFLIQNDITDGTDWVLKHHMYNNAVYVSVYTLGKLPPLVIWHINDVTNTLQFDHLMKISLENNKLCRTLIYSTAEFDPVIKIRRYDKKTEKTLTKWYTKYCVHRMASTENYKVIPGENKKGHQSHIRFLYHATGTMLPDKGYLE